MPHSKLKEMDSVDNDDSSATSYSASFGSIRQVNEEGSPYISPFESIRRVSEEGIEYWSARDLAKILGYARWDKFRSSIQKAEIACDNSGQAIQNHFSHVGNMVDIGSGARREIEDVHLSRYACYLVIQNADPSKEIAPDHRGSGRQHAGRLADAKRGHSADSAAGAETTEASTAAPYV